MDFTEFSEIVCNKTSKKTAKVRNSYGVYDAYKHIRKNSWYDIGRPLKEHEFYSIVRGVNMILTDAIAEGKPVTFPERMGALELRKRPKGVSIVDGKLKITYPVDWNSTLKLWFEDEEERKKKTSSCGYTFSDKINIEDMDFISRKIYELHHDNIAKCDAMLLGAYNIISGMMGGTNGTTSQRS